ncbi:MAG: ABC transporter substrate-binding protein [Actinobacteria bacterium]|nr:MAG: ABC transporter substrate-binding protein [Actinomycetota bacterium]
MRALSLGAAALVVTLLTGCVGTGGVASGGRIQVVAAESFWGSLASQLGGDRVRVTSIVSNPATDPHDYEPTPADGRALAGAGMVIVNGAGYDGWASKLLAASPSSGRVVLSIGDLVGVRRGGNPHRWYSPPDVERAIGAVTAGYSRLDPKHAPYFAARERSFETAGLRAYHGLIVQIRQRYAGTAVGASESIFAPMAQALGLRLITPSGFLAAISDGTDPTAADKATTDRQISTHAIRVWVYNRQNTTPDVQRLNAAARRAGVPVTTITETPVPASATFQAWQVAQLESLRRALARATGR